MKDFFKKRITQRTLFFGLIDIFSIIFAVVLSFFLRFDGKIPLEYIETGILYNTIYLALIFSLPIFYFFGLYSFSWSFVSATELISLAKAAIISFIFTGTSIFILKTFQGFPRSTLFISYFLIFIFCGTIRFAKRIYLELFKGVRTKKEKILIVGAGDMGEQFLRSIFSAKESAYEPVGFIDDNPSKQGISIHGLKVIGKIKDISNIVKRKEINQIIIALSSAEFSEAKRAVEQGRKAGIKKIKIVPSFMEMIKGEVVFEALKEVQIEDLLGREPVNIDTELIKNFIKNKTVLITGAAGSIGSELTRQIAVFGPSFLILLDQDETGIFNISEDLKNRFPEQKIISVIGDIVDAKKINSIFEKYKPNIVFHAAAYKHVPLMEENPDQAIRNNIFGTKIVAEAAQKFRAEKFILISTDKAINPSSIMGATKRVAEMICRALNEKNGVKFISVRFGNVLDSRGSVIPIFKEQIRKRGPVEVTHPDMERYFMLISEAVLLVLQAAEIGKGGEVFVLDMGKPVKILDLAKEMIRLSGFEPDKDIPIVFTKPRPGEKLFEEILTAEEGTTATKNEKIFIANLSNNINNENLFSFLKELEKIYYTEDKEKIKEIFKKIIIYFKSRNDS